MSENSNKKKKGFGDLFNNEKFLIAFSIFVAFVIWIGVAVGSGESVDYRISDIPVTMELSEDALADGLTVVSINGTPVDEFMATVKVTGNSVTVGSLTTSDIQVYGANLGTIVTSGTYNVALSAKSQGVKSNYSIVSVNPSEVTVVVDRNIEKELEIESQITVSVPSEYYMGSPTFSSKTVSIKGPEQSVSKVAKAVVIFDFDKELTETITLNNLDVTLLDVDGNAIEDDSLTIEPVTVDATIPVLIKKTVPIVLNCENEPNGLNLAEFVTIDPAEIEIAASEDIIESINSISIGSLDFNKLQYGTEYMDFEVVMPEGVRNLNNIDVARVYFKFSDMTSIQKSISLFQFANVPEGLVGEYSPYSNIKVCFVGPKSEVESIKSSNISAVIDLSGATMGTFDMPVNVTLSGVSSCWVYGTYSVNVTITDAASVSSNITSSTASSSDSSVADDTSQ